MSAQTQYFKSPQESVHIINDLLRSENFEELARYYNLLKTTIPLDSLTSGKYFLKISEPEMGIPGGFGKFSKPFPLGFKYMNHASEGNFIRVTVQYEIDQGDGMIQRAIQDFYLIKSEKGFQLVAR